MNSDIPSRRALLQAIAAMVGTAAAPGAREAGYYDRGYPGFAIEPVKAR